MTKTTKVEARGVEMQFPGPPPIRVLEPIDLDVHEGELVCLLGPSGCGKSTFLNLVAGFTTPTAGKITIDGKPVKGPDRKRIFVFQERGVFPWLSVSDNIGFGLAHLSKDDRQARITEYV